MTGLFWWRRDIDAKSLAAGGVHDNSAEVLAAHDAVAQREPMLVSQLREIYLRAQRLLTPGAMDAACQSIEDDLLAAHRLIEPLPAERKTPKSVTKLLSTRIRLAEAYVAKQADARALRSYNRGLGMATVYSMAVLVLIAFVGWALLRLIYRGGQEQAVSLALYQTLVAIGGGAAGAMVSVLLRTVTGIADVDDAALARAAVRRVVLGWIFAAVVVFFVKGGIVTVIKVPTDTDSGITQWFFWGGMGFLAGFNERWVRQLISRTPDADEPAKPKPEVVSIVDDPKRPPALVVKREPAPSANGHRDETPAAPAAPVVQATDKPATGE